MSEGNLSVLIVDDNQDIRDLLTHILEPRGFAIATAAEGYSALDQIEKKIPDLLLLDVMMPGLSGYEVVTMLRASSNPKIAHLPILLITAKSQLADLDTGLASGATSYLIKPFRPAALVEKIESIMSEALTSPAEVIREN